jgi:hypothetical protein
VPVIAWWALPCEAAERVLRAGLTDSEAVQQVAADAHIARSSLASVTLPALVAGTGPRLVGPGEVLGCAGEGTDPHAAAARAQDRILAGDDPGATREVDAAIARLGCARAELAIADVARLYYLRGVAAFDLDDLAAATAAFRQARILVPDLGWDGATFRDAGREQFMAALPAPEIELRILPSTGAARLVVDGLPFPVGPDGGRLPPGEHLVQLLGASAATIRLRVDGDAALLLPAEAGDEVSRWVADPHRAGALSELVDAFGGTDVGWVALEDGTWQRQGGAWTQVASHAPLAERTPTQRRDATGHRLVAVGATTLAAGLVGATVGLLEVRAASRWPEDPTDGASEDGAYAQAEPRWRTGRGVYLAGLGLGCAGLVTGSTGILLEVGW